MKTEGPITHGGVHPITHQRPTLQEKGQKGHAVSSTPKETQKAGAGAKPENSGVKKPANEKGNGSIAGSAETTTSGSSREEHSMASIMYPKQRGLKGRD